MCSKTWAIVSLCLICFNSQIAAVFENMSLRSSDVLHLKRRKEDMLISSYRSKFGVNLKYICSSRCLTCGQDWKLCESKDILGLNISQEKFTFSPGSHSLLPSQQILKPNGLPLSPLSCPSGMCLHAAKVPLISFWPLSRPSFNSFCEISIPALIPARRQLFHLCSSRAPKL